MRWNVRTGVHLSVTEQQWNRGPGKGGTGLTCDSHPCKRVGPVFVYAEKRDDPD